MDAAARRLLVTGSRGPKRSAFPDLYDTLFTYTPQMLQALHQIGLSRILYSVIGIMFNTVLLSVLYPVMGQLIYVCRWVVVMCVICAIDALKLGSAVTFYNFSSGDVVPTLAANPILHVATLVLFGVGETSLVVFFYLLPSGRFAPRWTRWAALVVVVYYLAVVFFPALPSNSGEPSAVFPVFSAERCRGPDVSLLAHIDTQRTATDEMGGLWLCAGNPASRCVPLSRVSAAHIYQ